MATLALDATNNTVSILGLTNAQFLAVQKVVNKHGDTGILQSFDHYIRTTIEKDKADETEEILSYIRDRLTNEKRAAILSIVRQ